MRKEGRRQDILYLGFVLVALLCAAVLVLAARAYRQQARPNTKSKQTARTTKKSEGKGKKRGSKTSAPVPVGPVVVAAPRDPFAGKEGTPGRRPRANDPGTTPPDRRDAQPQESEAPVLRLTGIVQGKEPMAVILLGDDAHYVNVGAAVGEYTLVRIDTRSVVMSGGGKTFTLAMHRDKSEGSKRPTNRRTRPVRR